MPIHISLKKLKVQLFVSVLTLQGRFLNFGVANTHFLKKKLKVQSFVSVLPLHECFLNYGVVETVRRVGVMLIWAF